MNKLIKIIIVILLLCKFKFDFKCSKGVNEIKEVSISYESNVNLQDVIKFFDYLN